MYYFDNQNNTPILNTTPTQKGNKGEKRGLILYEVLFSKYKKTTTHQKTKMLRHGTCLPQSS